MRHPEEQCTAKIEIELNHPIANATRHSMPMKRSKEDLSEEGALTPKFLIKRIADVTTNRCTPSIKVYSSLPRQKELQVEYLRDIRALGVLLKSLLSTQTECRSGSTTKSETFAQDDH